jgi:hypothetical protein
MKTALLAFASTLLAAGAATAQPLDLRLADSAASSAVIIALPTPAKAVPDLADPLDPLARPKLQPQAVDSAIFARTAVDAKVAGREGLTASAGFLCGLQPGHYDSGGAAAYGVDPHGRFVGAKFAVAF